MEKTTPEKTIRVGNGIKATIWPNEGKSGTWFNVTLSRTYKDTQGKLQDSSTFTQQELLQVSKAAELAFDYLLEKAKAK